MSDDAEQIRAQARRVAELADRARTAAASVTAAGGVQWRSVGADRYRERLTDRARDFRARADDLDRLSRLLFAHATHVEDHERVLASLASATGNVVAGAVKHSADSAHAAGTVGAGVAIAAVSDAVDDLNTIRRHIPLVGR
ncbi:hypothetical protein [Rudaeicoccus suwonensis]|uniref:hypothetical protein n=1 Tax=Rudaeicoccus suwonensis TaxID=657409 RepID=UPI0011A0ECDA|nr:hypothetical protein [Rudaeicoccus suwonensis]